MRIVCRTGVHTRHRLLFHIVFVPKYRRIVLRHDVAHRLKQLFWQVCQMNDWGIEKLEILPDQVQLFCQGAPRLLTEILTFKLSREVMQFSDRYSRPRSLWNINGGFFAFKRASFNVFKTRSES